MNKFSIILIFASLGVGCGYTQLQKSPEPPNVSHKRPPLRLILSFPVNVFDDITAIRDEYILLSEITSEGCGEPMYGKALDELVLEAQKHGADGVINVTYKEGTLCMDAGDGPHIYAQGQLIKYLKNIQVWDDTSDIEMPIHGFVATQLRRPDGTGVSTNFNGGETSGRFSLPTRDLTNGIYGIYLSAHMPGGQYTQSPEGTVWFEFRE